MWQGPQIADLSKSHGNLLTCGQSMTALPIAECLAHCRTLDHTSRICLSTVHSFPVQSYLGVLAMAWLFHEISGTSEIGEQLGPNHWTMVRKEYPPTHIFKRTAEPEICQRAIGAASGSSHLNIEPQLQRQTTRLRQIKTGTAYSARLLRTLPFCTLPGHSVCWS